MSIQIQPVGTEDYEWVCRFLQTYNHGLRVVSRGKMHEADRLPGFIASHHGIALALLTYHAVGDELEVVTLHAAKQGCGLGSRLLVAARQRAQELGCRRLWLITTNDNKPAIRFYKRRGMALVAVHANALELSRQLKPEIPLLGLDGVPIRDEIEFEYRIVG